MTILKPAGGFLVTDGRSIVPLQIVLGENEDDPQRNDEPASPQQPSRRNRRTKEGRRKTDEPPPAENRSRNPHRKNPPRIVGARIIAAQGEVSAIRIVAARRVQFLYKCPRSDGGVTEFLDVAVTLDDHASMVEGFALTLPPPASPRVELIAHPERIDAQSPTDIELITVARGQQLHGVALAADQGRLDHRSLVGDTVQRTQTAVWRLPDLPINKPSHLTTVAVAAQPTGFAAAVSGLSASAPVRLTADIPAGSWFEVEGPRSSPPPVPAAKRGKTVMDDVLVTYGQPLNAYRVNGGQRRPLSIVFPTGIVSTGLAVAIPGQAVADGGTGPTVVLGLPPGPFGAPPFLPEVAVEGAKIVETVQLSPRTVAVVLQRPPSPGTLTVRLDGIPVGRVSLSGGHGQIVKTSEAPLRPGERAALRFDVLDASGFATDTPKPRVFGVRGEELSLEREQVGRYRTALPGTLPGEPGSKVDLVVELSPPPIIAGTRLEPTYTPVNVQLRSPALVARAARPPILVRPPGDTQPGRSAFELSVAGAASAGATVDSMQTFGGYVQGELRFPFWARRFGVRIATEVGFSRGSGLTDFGNKQRVESVARVTALAIPLEGVFGVLRWDTFEIAVHAGGALRFDQGSLEVAGDSAGGGRNVHFTGRAGLEGRLDIGPAALFLGTTVVGIGGRLNDLTSGEVRFDGSLIQVRGELGVRFWVFP